MKNDIINKWAFSVVLTFLLSGFYSQEKQSSVVVEKIEINEEKVEIATVETSENVLVKKIIPKGTLMKTSEFERRKGELLNKPVELPAKKEDE